MDLIVRFTDWLWGWPLVVTIISVSIIYSFRLKFFQFRKFGHIMKNTIGTLFSKKESLGEGTLTPIQAVSSALAGTLGVGNIAGVGVAIAMGGQAQYFGCG